MFSNQLNAPWRRIDSPLSLRMNRAISFAAGTLLLGLAVNIMPADASAASGLDTKPGQDLTFGVGGTPVGDWSGSQFSIKTPVVVTGSVAVTSGGTVATATVSTIQTANALAALGACTTGQALTKNIDGSFSCLAVTDLAGAGNATIPSCTAAQSLYYNGQSFSCQNIASSAPPVCTGANLLQFDGTSYQCVSLASLTGGNCGSYTNGQIFQTIDNNNSGSYCVLNTYQCVNGVTSFVGRVSAGALVGTTPSSGNCSPQY